MKKFRIYVDLEKEEKWLNEMANKGWEFHGKCVNYEFREYSPDDPAYIKMDYRSFKSNDDFQNYIALFKDSGWEHIAGTKTSGKQYFKRTEVTAGDDIFSDVSSKAERYKKMSNMWLSLAVCYIPIFIALVLTKAININALLDPKLLYYTPGLWQKTGEVFWRAFLFETPFAMMRGYIWLLFPCLIILYVVFAVKAQKYYRKANPKT